MALKDDIKNQIKEQIRSERVSNIPQRKNIGRFFSNVKTDITDLAKGLLFIGRKVITDPIESAKTVGSTLKEVGLQVPGASVGLFKEAADTIANPIKRFKTLKSDYQKLRAIPYQDQKKLLDNITRQAIESTKSGTRGQKALATLGAGLLSETVKEVTHPIEFAYEKPFTFGIDVLSLGGGRVVGNTAKSVSKTTGGKKILEAIEREFVPNAKLKQAGFESFGNDLIKTKTNIFNSQQGIIKSTAQKFEKEFGLNKVERFEFFESIDKLRRSKDGIKATSKNPKIQTAINWWLDDQVPRLRKSAGLADESSITNYLHHFFPEKLKQIEAPKSAGLKASEKGFLKRSKDITGFSKDPIVSISAIKSKLALSSLRDSFVVRTINKYSKNIDDLKNELSAKIGLDNVKNLDKSGKLIDTLKREFNLEQIKPGALSSIKNIDNILLPKAIVDEVSKFFSPETTNILSKGLDFFNRNWKPLATATRPRYHTRNVLGNLYNGVILGETKLNNIPQAAWQQVGNYFNELRKSNTKAGKLSKKIFPQFGGTKLIKQAIKDDVIGRGFFAMDLHDLSKMSESSDNIIKAINQVKNPAEIYRIPFLRQYLNMSFNAGAALEDNGRLALYIDRIKKGATRVEAKADVNKFLFDYLTGLSETDKAIKKLIPFWSWQRFNTPLQFESLITKPKRQALIAKSTGPIVEQVERETEVQEFLTEKEKEAGFIKVGEVEQNGKTLDKFIKTESVLPQDDLTKIIDVFRFDLNQLGINPLIGLSQRLASNTNFFGGMLERFSDEKKKFLGLPLKGKTIEKLKLIPFLSELNKLIGGSFIDEDKPGLPIRLEQVISPLGTTLKDREETKFFGILEKEQELTGSYEGGLQSLYVRYLSKLSKSSEEKTFRDNVEELEALLKEKGVTELDLLPLKIKAMKRSIQDQIKSDIKSQIQSNK